MPRDEKPKSLQLTLELVPIRHAEIDGIAMGVLNDGTPFLTTRGLAKLCGVHHTAIQVLGSNWDVERHKPRGVRLRGILAEHGHDGRRLFVPTKFEGQDVNAYVDAVCMAILEYYAFERAVEVAQRSFRILARYTLRKFIFDRVGYDPERELIDSWKHFHDRVMLNQVPNGYYSVFSEISGVVVAAIRGGLKVDTHVVPDISVGRIWSDYWSACGLDEVHGQRTKFPHQYPPYFPQAAVYIEAFIYPLASLPAFRDWLQNEYLPQKFPAYIKKKGKDGHFPKESIDKLLEAINAAPALPSHDAD